METRLIGKIVSRRFRIEEIVGRGGMAIVYRAFDLKTHQTVAFKVLREEYENDEEYKERFNREAEACKKLNHPNIVNLIDSGAVGGIRYIALEYVDGQTLKDIIKKKGKLPQEDAVHYTLQILSALGHAHGRKIIHRDVKPQNMMVTRNGQLKVADFGIAGMADTKTLTSDGSVIGSVHYFSPEQAKGMRATEASDLYSVGVILYEMLTGHVPFDGETSVSVAMMHLMKEPKPVETETEVTPALAKIVAKALQKQPADRYQNAEEMIRDLRRGLRHPDGHFLEDQRHKRNGKTAKKTGNLALRNAFIAAGAVLVALVLIGGVHFYRSVFLVTRMPDLTGMDQTSAELMAKNAGLVPNVEWVSGGTTEGYVMEQQPEAAKEVRRGTEITLFVSQGNGMLTMPRVIGLSAEEAYIQLKAVGFEHVQEDGVVSEVMKGLVASQTPEAGTQLDAEGSVMIYVSLGRVQVPDFVNLREEEAIQRMNQVGLTLQEITYVKVKSPSLDGIVTSQSVEPFQSVKPGTEIDIGVGRYELMNKTYTVPLNIDVPEMGCSIRISLVDGDVETTQYSAFHSSTGSVPTQITLRSETSGPKKWRLYIDGNLREEHEITIL